MSKELMPQVETSKRNPYLPKEVRAIIYAYLGGPSNVIRFELYVHSRDPADSRCFKIDNHLTSSCDIHVPSVAFGIESWSRISALENNIQLHPRTKFQPRPVYFRPKLDVIQIPAMMFYDGRSFNDHWDRVYGNWGWHFAMMDKIENLTVRIRQYDIQKLHQRWYLWSQIDRGVPRPAYYGEASWKVLRVRMYFPDHMEEMGFKSRSDLELTKFLLERNVVLYYNGADYYFKEFMGGD